MSSRLSIRSLPEFFFAKSNPTPVTSPRLAAFNAPLADSLSIRADLGPLCGNSRFRGFEPLALAYAGHQFGSFTMLGDGRAHLIGEIPTPLGLVDLQLKGSGATPFSRRGDGRAALSPMLREFLVSEAMAALGIPTTRSLSVVSTGEAVWREAPVPGGVLARIASSHIRVGTFEYAATYKGAQGVEAVLRFAMDRHFPHARNAAEFFSAVVESQAQLIARWMGVGFVHGVMNTDNMAISGETLDFGPCAFLEHYDPNQVFSSIDRRGRYAYSQQPRIAQWNLAILAECLSLVAPDREVLRRTLLDFERLYRSAHREVLGRKLGMSHPVESDDRAISDFLESLARDRKDFTLGFLAEGGPIANPRLIPRNHWVEIALRDESGQVFSDLLEAVRNPYSSDPRFDRFAQPAQDHERVTETFCGT